MATHTQDKLAAIIGAYHQVGAQLNKLEAALSAVDMDELKEDGQGFIRDMAWCRRRMKETHIIYSSDVIELESNMAPLGCCEEENELRTQQKEKVYPVA